MLTQIEATLTFEDGQTVQILLSPDSDSAWGNVESVLWRSVPVRESICRAMWDDELWTEEVDEDEDN